jgi:uncharacterized protein (DUF1800 family)
MRVRGLAEDPREAVFTYLEEQLDPESIEDRAAERAARRFEALSEPAGELFEYQQDFLLQQMTSSTLLRAVQSRRQLYEVMVQFWTDHFNIDPSKGDCKWLKAADDRDVIRRHALGRFPELVRASALSPAMLWYLDGRVNRKEGEVDRPNENYARELLELHTLGVHGGYTQRDVMEVARCLSGWTVRSEEVFYKGRVVFHPEFHDDGPKEVLGHTIPAGQGEKDLDQVLGIVTLHPSTARYIAWKLCRRFISDEPLESVVTAVADAFLQNEGDIRATLRVLFVQEEFLTAQGRKFKRPFHFVVSALRATAARTDGGRELTDYLIRMGHAPFQYPTPDGYPEEPSPWMGGLLWRWNFAAALSENRIPRTTIDPAKLAELHGGEDGLMAHLLGRRPTGTEREGARRSGAGLALMLASPGFQRC